MTGEMRGASRQSSRAVRGQTSQFHTTLSGWGADDDALMPGDELLQRTASHCIRGRDSAYGMAQPSGRRLGLDATWPASSFLLLASLAIDLSITWREGERPPSVRAVHAPAPPTATLHPPAVYEHPLRAAIRDA